MSEYEHQQDDELLANIDSESAEATWDRLGARGDKWYLIAQVYESRGANPDFIGKIELLSENELKKIVSEFLRIKDWSYILFVGRIKNVAVQRNIKLPRPDILSRIEKESTVETWKRLPDYAKRYFFLWYLQSFSYEHNKDLFRSVGFPTYEQIAVMNTDGLNKIFSIALKTDMDGNVAGRVKMEAKERFQ